MPIIKFRNRDLLLRFRDALSSPKASDHVPASTMPCRHRERRPAKDNRAAGIRTRDLLNPIQAHYQAVLRPVFRRPLSPPDRGLPKCFHGGSRGSWRDEKARAGGLLSPSDRALVPPGEEGVDQLR